MVSRCWRSSRRAQPARRRAARCAAQRRAARHRARGGPPDAHHRRGGGARADGRARLPARPVLSPAELRDAGARRVDGTTLAMEGLALTGAWVDRETRAALDHRAGDGRLVRSLRAAEAGRAGGADGPDRHADRDPGGETVLLVGGGLGNAVLFSIGQAMRANGSRVLYFAGYKTMRRPLQGGRDRARGRRDGVVLRRSARLRARPRRRTAPSSAISSRRWTPTDGRARAAADPARRRRPRHRHRLGRHDGARSRGRATGFSPPISSPVITAIGSINSPMQCMMKEICAQCLQVHKDPATGVETVVFSCFNQDQDAGSGRFRHACADASARTACRRN